MSVHFPGAWLDTRKRLEMNLHFVSEKNWCEIEFQSFVGFITTLPPDKLYLL